jgi:Protein of unknown function (DUF2637)
MDRWVAGAHRLVAVIIVAGTTVALAQSYRSLVDWSLAHQIPRQWAWSWPLMVDSFLVVGELRLFIAAARGASIRVRVWAWCVTLGGLAISVAGNVGHLQHAAPAGRGTAAVPPLAAAVALGVGLGLVKAHAAGHVNRPGTPKRRLRRAGGALVSWARAAAARLHTPPERDDVPPLPLPPPLPATGPADLPSPDAVLLAVLAAEAAEGTLRMSRRAVHERHAVTEWKAQQLLNQLAAASNGHH